VGKRWSALLDRALAHAQDDRFADATAMRDALQEELLRLHVTAPRHELEAWLDGPEAYDEAHAKKMIARLCETAAEARKAGRALDAAADYNRALAFAPADPALLKLVASVHRAESRARLLRNVARAAAVTVVLGAAAFFVTRALKHSIDPDPAPPRASALTTNSAAPSAPAPASAQPSVVASVVPPSSATAPHPIQIVPLKSILAPSPVKEAKRDVALTVSFPPNGVLASMDDSGAVTVSGSYSFSVDATRAHSLKLSCMEDLCVPKAFDIPAGEAPFDVATSLTIRDATLIVHGDANATYAIVEMPQIAVRADMAVKVPMNQRDRVFTVRQLPSGKTQSKQLYAGKAAEVSFTP